MGSKSLCIDIKLKYVKALFFQLNNLYYLYRHFRLQDGTVLVPRNMFNTTARSQVLIPKCNVKTKIRVKQKIKNKIFISY